MKFTITFNAGFEGTPEELFALQNGGLTFEQKQQLINQHKEVLDRALNELHEAVDSLSTLVAKKGSVNSNEPEQSNQSKQVEQPTERKSTADMGWTNIEASDPYTTQEVDEDDLDDDDDEQVVEMAQVPSHPCGSTKGSPASTDQAVSSVGDEPINGNRNLKKRIANKLGISEGQVTSYMAEYRINTINEALNNSRIPAEYKQSLRELL